MDNVAMLSLATDDNIIRNSGSELFTQVKHTTTHMVNVQKLVMDIAEVHMLLPQLLQTQLTLYHMPCISAHTSNGYLITAL